MGQSRYFGPLISVNFCLLFVIIFQKLETSESRFIPPPVPILFRTSPSLACPPGEVPFNFREKVCTGKNICQMVNNRRCAIPGQRPSVNYAPVQPQFSGHPSFVSSQPQPQIQVQGVQPQQWTGQTATRTQTQTWAPQPAATPQLQTVPIQSEVSAALPATITQPRSLPAAPATEVPTIMVANSTALPTTSTSPLNSSVEMTMRLLSQTLSAPGTVEWTTTRPENIILTVEPNATSPLTTMKPYLNWNNRSAESKEVLRDCKTVYESICDETQTPRCRVTPRQVCQTVKAEGHEADHDPHDEDIELVESGGSTLAAKTTSAPMPSTFTKNGLKTTTPVSEPTNYPTTTSSMTTGKPDKTMPPPQKARSMLDTNSYNSQSSGENSGAPTDSLPLDCPKNMAGYDCTQKKENICRKVEQPVCSSQNFESCTVAAVNQTSEICHSVVNKICRISNAGSSTQSAPKSGQDKMTNIYKPSVYSNSNNFASDSSQTYPGTTNQNYAGATNQNYASAVNQNYPGVPNQNYAGVTNKNYVNTANQNSPGETNQNYAGSANKNYASNNAVDNLVDDVNEVDDQSDGQSSRYKRDADRNRVMTTCRQKVVSVCSTKNEIVIQPGMKSSCVKVPTYRCDDLSVGPYGSPVESCTQHQEQICNQFPVFEPVPQPKTVCENVTVPDCEEEVYDERNVLVSKNQKQSQNKIVCEDIPSQICGIQSSIDLVVDECADEEKTACQSGYSEKCGLATKRTCKSKTNGEPFVCIVR